ncbi:hypothetical protein K432DRAFT_246108, partial [Lepidopterella palustris CBS 459.81]
HRRVELQSLADLVFLKQNAHRAAREKLDLNFPRSEMVGEGGEDELRRLVEGLVEEYIRNTFAAAKQNISINGMDTEEAEMGEVGQEFEPFDSRLKLRLEALTAQKNALIARVADLRRTAPAQAAASFQSAFLAEDQAFQNEIKACDERIMEEKGEGEREGLVKEGLRWDEVQRTWVRAVEGLGRLKGGLPEARARMERAEGVVRYLEGR